jgi:hypothetical protein
MENTQYDEIIRNIKAVPNVCPKDNLTDKVMSSLPLDQETYYFRVKKLILSPHKFSIDPEKALKGLASIKECSLYFFLMGFLYSILGAVIYLGLKNYYHDHIVQKVISFQPQVSFAIAIILFISSFLLLIDHIRLIKLAKAAIFLYLEIIIINGLLLMLSIGKNIILISVIGLVGASFFAGVFFIKMLQNLPVNREA